MTPSDGGDVAISKSWGLVRALADHSEVRDAELAIILPDADPSPVQVFGAKKGMAAKSSGGKKHKSALQNSIGR